MTLANAVNNKSPGIQYLQNSGVFTAVDGATNTLLKGAGTNTAPSYTAFPQISGLGVGASAGSTAGITFNGTDFLNTYTIGTFTPAISGSAGTPSYNFRNGFYFRVGNLVQCSFRMNYAVTGSSGDVLLSGLPFTIKNQTNGIPLNVANLSTFTFPAGRTYLLTKGIINSTTANMTCCGSLVASANQQFQDTSAGNTQNFSLMYEI